MEDGVKRELTRAERLARIRITKQNAEHFFAIAQKRDVTFRPVGTIQGLDAEGYARTAIRYHDIGYRHLALGGLVPMPDAALDEIVTAVMLTVASLKPRPWVHLFGVFRPKLQAKFRQLGIDSFDSATYFRKSWLRSDQNYLAPNGAWYAALRIPMTSDGRTRKRLEESGLDMAKLEKQERNVLRLVCRYGSGMGAAKEVVDAVIEYDERLTRASDFQSMRSKYNRTLLDRPWESCDCPFCTKIGIHMLVFRGSNRNKRRGAHNTLMLYRQVS
jgi:Queuine tRNA-ribosyltransferase